MAAATKKSLVDGKKSANILESGFRKSFHDERHVSQAQIDFETQRLTLLEAVEDRRELNKKNVLHRLFLLGMISKGESPDRFGGFVLEQLQKIVKRLGGDVVSGFLLIYPEHYIHILEGFTDQLYQVIQWCSSSTTNEFMIGPAYVIEFTHDSFTSWMWTIVSIHRNEEFDMENPVAITTEFIMRLLNLCTFMSEHTLDDLKEALDALVESVRDMFPSEVAVETLLKMECLESTQEFINSYFAPADLILDADVVWPVQALPYSVKLK